MTPSILSHVQTCGRDREEPGKTKKRTVVRLSPEEVDRLDRIAKQLSGSALMGGESVSRDGVVRALVKMGAPTLEAELHALGLSPGASS